MADTKELWAVSIMGPDDLIPVDDYGHGVRFAHRFNSWWADRVAKEHREYDPHMWAIPIIWDGSREQHAEWCAKPSVDYQQMFLAARETTAA